jgi:hypothetical protein
MDSLGMEYSEHKSVSAIDPSVCGAEFAKRIFLDGTEITGIPAHLLVNAIESSEYHLAL